MHKQWGSGEQHDAIEFLLWLLGNVDAFDAIFRYYFAFTPTDLPEQNPSCIEQDTTLHLNPIVPYWTEQVDLSAMLSELGNSIATGNMSWALVIPSRVLIIQLPRFTGGTNKNTTNISFPQVLGEPFFNVIYKLNAVVSHYGRNPHSGHYKAFVHCDRLEEATYEHVHIWSFRLPMLRRTEETDWFSHPAIPLPDISVQFFAVGIDPQDVEAIASLRTDSHQQLRASLARRITGWAKKEREGPEPTNVSDQS